MKSRTLRPSLLRQVTAIALATIWISFSEFLRNQLLFKAFWTDHYTSLGLVFPQKATNGAIWGLWSLGLASLIYILAPKFTFKQTVVVTWFSGIVLMWIAIGNLGVLPVKLLVPAIPLSIIEVLVATVIVTKLQKTLSK